MSLEITQIRFAFFSIVHQMWVRAVCCSILTIFFNIPILTSAIWMALLVSSCQLAISENNKFVLLFDSLFKFMLFFSLKSNSLFYIWYLTLSFSNYIDFSIQRQNAQSLYISRSLQQEHEVFNFIYTIREKSMSSLCAYFVNSVVEGYIIQNELVHSQTIFKLLPMLYCFIQIYCLNINYSHLQEIRVVLPRRDSKMQSQL
eukprot:NODE_163_length_16507_cov_1.031814.p9 type:complete len:201 gc:universal NODE_163_length_16507_cov_1.031814:12638-13240(+)